MNFIILVTISICFNICKFCCSENAIKNDGLELPENFTEFLESHGLTQPVNVDYSRGYQSELGIDFKLYNKNNKNGLLISSNTSTEELKGSIISGAPFKFISHGWWSSETSKTVGNIKTAYIDSGQNVNIVTVNWEVVAGKMDYRASATDTHNVGKELANLILYLHDNNLLNIEDLHLIGHSLGAHVSGTAGHYVNKSGKMVSRITGLDPAGPGFEFFNSFLFDSSTMALNKEQASFVDVIHTSSGTLGFSSPIGHIDFYPNGGTHPMPGCGIQGRKNSFKIKYQKLVPDKVACSHARAHVYFGESIQYDKSNHNIGFLARSCDSFNDYLKGSCSNNEEILMGEYTENSKTGIFYLATNDESLYALNGRSIEGNSSWFSYSPLSQLSPF